MKSVSKTSILFVCFFIFAACAKKPSVADDGSYQTKGILQKIDQSGARLVISHEEIPGYMPAMTMAFELEDPARAASLAPGDAIEFSFLPTGDGKFVVKSLRKADHTSNTTQEDLDYHH